MQMASPQPPLFGDFTVFGFTCEPEMVWQRKLSHYLGIVPIAIGFGYTGHFFFYSTHGDVAETEEKIVLTLGFARTVDGSWLSAQDLLKQPGITPRSIAPEMLRGNALVACFSKIEATFSVYKTLMAMPQLYFNATGQTVFCTDNLACLVPFLENPQLNEDILAQHFLCKFALGTATYFKDTHRLFPGELLTWREGHLEVKLARDLRFANQSPLFSRVDPASLARFYDEFRGVIGAYIDNIQQSGHTLGNLLSGGVDSSIIQHLLSEHLVPGSSPRSFSYAMQTSDFEFEVEYAKRASRALQTEHTFVNVLPEEYPALLQETIRLLAQPIFTNAEPCMLALSKYLALDEPGRRFYFRGQGADALCGLPIARKLAVLDAARKLPGSSQILKLSAAFLQILEGPSSRKAHGLRHMARMLPELDNPHSLDTPFDVMLTDEEIEIARRCFGDRALKLALQTRHDLEAQYLQSSHPVEKFQVIDLLTEGYEHAICGYQAFLVNNKTQVYPYFDEDVIRRIFDFAPHVRYVTPGLSLIDRYNVKPLLRQVLERYAPAAAPVNRQQKGFSVFNEDVYRWMKNGVLRQMVQAIDRPAFLSMTDYRKVLDHPREFAWRLLTLDIFQKEVLRPGVSKQ